MKQRSRNKNKHRKTNHLNSEVFYLSNWLLYWSISIQVFVKLIRQTLQHFDLTQQDNKCHFRLAKHLLLGTKLLESDKKDHG